MSANWLQFKSKFLHLSPIHGKLDSQRLAWPRGEGVCQDNCPAIITTCTGLLYVPGYHVYWAFICIILLYVPGYQMYRAIICTVLLYVPGYHMYQPVICTEVLLPHVPTGSSRVSIWWGRRPIFQSYSRVIFLFKVRVIAPKLQGNRCRD